ncbi:MAG TPA: CHASE3 domain-containing protein, partial [bacterium]|nr:CHASE3 domain-containing protein [bacterium]
MVVWSMTLSLKKKLYLGFGVLTLVIVGMGSLFYLSISQMLESDDWVDHTEVVISHIKGFDSNFKKAQSSYRAYILSKDPSFLKTAQASMNLVLPQALETQQMTQDNQAQRENFSKLIPLLEDRVNGQDLLLSNKPDRFTQALTGLKDPQNQEINETIDKLISQTLVQEQNLLLKRREAETSYAHIASLILLAGAITATFFAFGALLTIRAEVTKREKVQEALQLNEYRLFQFLEAVPLGIFVLDKNGKPFYANQKARELLGRGLVQSTDGDGLGFVQKAYQIDTDIPYPPDQIPIGKALKGEKSSIEDIEIHQEDGRIIPLQIWGTPVVDMRGELQYALAIFSDITERRQVEEMKKSLISVVSHQLKTPVGEINGYVENLLDGLAGELTPKQTDYLMDMREIGMNNYRLISDILNLSKIERGLTSANPERMPLMEVIQLSMRDYEAIMARKGLTFRLEGLEGCPDILADRDKLVETLRNLLNNAIKFTDKGEVVVSVRAEGQTDEGVFLHWTVSDTGIGIPADKQ